MNTVNVGLIQMACGESIADNVQRSIAGVREAAGQGANIVCLQELFDARYFPQRVEVESTRLAQPLPSPTTEKMGQLAAELGIVLIVPIYEEAQPGVYFNTVVVFDADGSYLGKYRKTHIPDGPQYHEKYYFTPGDMGYPTFETRFGRIAVGICWDEWFPEVARIFALQGPWIIFYPSAIGSEPDCPDYSSAEAWRTVIRSHGITNGVFIGAVNRVGVEEAMTFYGQSFISDPFGELLAEASGDEQVLVAALEIDKVREMRDLLQFHRDRRIDTYGPLLKRVIE